MADEVDAYALFVDTSGRETRSWSRGIQRERIPAFVSVWNNFALIIRHACAAKDDCRESGSCCGICSSHLQSKGTLIEEQLNDKTFDLGWPTLGPVNEKLCSLQTLAMNAAGGDWGVFPKGWLSLLAVPGTTLKRKDQSWAGLVLSSSTRQDRALGHTPSFSTSPRITRTGRACRLPRTHQRTRPSKSLPVLA